MDAQEKYEYWLDIAQYDFAVAESMLKASIGFTSRLCANKPSRNL